MAKYDAYIVASINDEFLKAIANELAESNRLKRIALKLKYPVRDRTEFNLGDEE